MSRRLRRSAASFVVEGAASPPPLCLISLQAPAGATEPGYSDRLLVRADITGPAQNTRDPQAAVREFAGLFYSMILKEMQKTVPENPFTGGSGQEVFRTMWINEMGRKLAQRRDDALVEALMENFEKPGGGEGAV